MPRVSVVVRCLNEETHIGRLLAGIEQQEGVAAIELAESGIRVNAVLPGAVDTPMLRFGLERMRNGMPEDEAYAALALKTPLGRVAAPREIAEVILFLADTDRSSFVTGKCLSPTAAPRRN